MTASCRSCGAAIEWVHTTQGRTMPIDATPVSDGNVVLTGRMTKSDGGVTRPEVRVETAGTAGLFETGDRYVAHFTTCPQADTWRRDRRHP